MNISHICRICMDSERTTKNLFKTKLRNVDVPLIEVFTFVTNINISRNDGCPMEVCSLCIRRMLESFRFKHQAKEADQEFKKQFQTKLYGEQIETSAPNETVNAQAQESVITGVTDESDEGYANENLVDINELDIVLCAEEPQVHEDGVQLLSGLDQQSTVVKDAVELKKSRHKCQVCAREFSRKSNLVDHLRLHANLKLFQCKHCDKSFVQIANYRTHLRIHTNERPFQCQICNKSYNQSSSLKIHMRSHTDERNYHCDLCPKTFTNCSDLKKHKRVHNPDMQFTCEICGKLFAQKVNMLSHKRRLHTLENNESISNKI